MAKARSQPPPPLAGVKIRDVAREAGVSETTAFRALRGDARVVHATIERVKRAAEKLNYRPNVFARSVFTRKSYSVGVVLPRVGGFWARILAGIQDEANLHGYNLIVYTLETSEPAKEREFTHRLIERMVDGVIISPVLINPGERPHLDELRTRQIPLVVVDRLLSGFKASTVFSDDETGAYEAVEYLHRLGHRRIAHFAGPQDTSTAVLRRKGYLRALQELGLAHYPAWDYAAESFEDELLGARSYAWVRDLLQRGDAPTAYFLASDYAAPGVYRALLEHGLRIPRDASVLGYANMELAKYIEPPLSSIEQSTYEMGQAAVRLLLESIASGRHDQVKKLLLTTTLIERGSTAPPPAA